MRKARALLEGAQWLHWLNDHKHRDRIMEQVINLAVKDSEHGQERQQEPAEEDAPDRAASDGAAEPVE